MRPVLFVCVENSFRSQMAEAFFTRNVPEEFRAVSAGTAPADIVNPRSLEVMKEAGDWGITDPKDKPLEEIRKIRDEIKDRVEKLIRELSSVKLI